MTSEGYDTPEYRVRVSLEMLDEEGSQWVICNEKVAPANGSGDDLGMGEWNVAVKDGVADLRPWYFGNGTLCGVVVKEMKL